MNEMVRGRPVALVIARTAQSLASEPEWPIQTLRSPSPGVTASSFSANPIACSLGYINRLAVAISRTALLTASTTRGWA